MVGKGNKIRPCFLDYRAMEHLDAYLALRTDKNSALYLSELTRDRITKGTVQMVFRNLSRIYSSSKLIHPHTMRHSFATNLLRNNANLFHVSKLMGHSSTQTTEVYLHYTDADLQKAYDDKHTI